MSTSKPNRLEKSKTRKLAETVEILTALEFGSKQRNETAAYSLLALLDLTAFETRRAMQSFLSQIAWESEVWIAEDPDHMIHFNGERFLGPYPDVMPE